MDSLDLLEFSMELEEVFNITLNDDEVRNLETLKEAVDLVYSKSSQKTFGNSWQEFRDTGLLWWINRSLHLFGWAIFVNVDKDGNAISAYPAKCKFRGFDTESETEGFTTLTQYLKENSEDLLEDLKE